MLKNTWVSVGVVRVVSSVYIVSFGNKLQEGRSIIEIVNKRGPKIDPFGKPRYIKSD